MAKQIPAKEQKEIVKAIESGESVNQVAKKFKRSTSTISRYVKKNNVKLAYANPKKANDASRFYNKDKRMELLKIAFEKAKELIVESEQFTTNDMKNISMALGILIDKQRLEEGEPTEISNSNVNNTNMVHPSELTKEAVETLAKRLRERNGSS